MRSFDEKEFQSFLLGSLLHDIGKLLGRPRDSSSDHPDRGADFVGKHKHSIEKIGFDFGVVDNIIRYHHKKALKKMRASHAKALVNMVHQADMYSAGERPKDKEEDPKTKPLGFYPLDPVFARIDLQVDKDAQVVRKYDGRQYHHELKTLSYADIFPRAFPLPDLSDNAKGQVEELYRGLETSFSKDFEEAVCLVPSTSDQSQQRLCFLYSVYSLLYRHLWCVPDDVGRQTRDISLFDHTRIAAAIAACLYIYHHETDTLDDEGGIEDQMERKFLLTAGDLSGIQKYLYSVSNIGIGGVAKRLRARSFFLTALVEVVSHRILKEVAGNGRELPLFCKIMASGGNFLILLPNLPSLSGRLLGMDKDINGWLLNEFQGDLSFAFAHEPLNGVEFEIERQTHGSRITAKLNALHDQLERNKTAKLSQVLVGADETKEPREGEGAWLPALFVWNSAEFKDGACRSCGANPAIPGIAGENDPPLCRRCDRDRRLGEHLAKTKYICYVSGDIDAGNSYSFFAGRYSVTVEKDKERIPAGAYIVQTTEPEHRVYGKPYFFQPYANHVPLFETREELEVWCREFCHSKTAPIDCDFYKALTEEQFRTSTGIQPSGFPAIKTFECLAACSKGEKLLGVLKADVDRLGFILSEGLSETATSLSRIATLSRMIDLFFGGWLDNLLRSDAMFKEVYTVYAGGDDLVLTGPWDTIIELSYVIANKFRDYVAGNPHVTVSAGIAVTKPKYPITKSTELADRHLDRAKGYLLPDSEKETQKRNGVYLFGTRSVWFRKKKDDVEFAALKEWGDKICGLMASADEKKQLTSGMAYGLLQFSEMCRCWLEERNIENLRYLPLMSYMIGRNIEDDKVKKALKEEFIDDPGKKQLFSKMRMPLTLALLKNRNRDRKRRY